MASLPAKSWKLFGGICRKYAQSELKDQAVKACDKFILPAIKLIHIRPITGLSDTDREHLLEEVCIIFLFFIVVL